ncbi:MAG: hypothetical protein K2K90_01485 [Lachnospiraceae bacterium]|nr:hypothetical protein [Lachnospiraceae bacterium]
MFVSKFFLLLLGITVPAFFLLPVKWRAGVLLTASYVFCAHMEPRALIILAAITAATYFMAVYIEKLRDRGCGGKAGRTVAAAICGLTLLLVLYKYMGYLAECFGVADKLSEHVLKNLMMPVGLSFYAFQATGYLADVYKRRIAAERNFCHFACYLSFFPRFVSGPIERGERFLPQMRRLGEVRFWNRGRLSAAFTYMLWGSFMKLVVADRLGGMVNPLFAEPEAFDSFWLLLGVMMYSIQIYCDFAGYSYIAAGCAKIFGIELQKNFSAPYRAVNIQEFWRRWHISLSSWLRDYIYIPLGGNRKGVFRKNLNILIVFFVCGAWHGAGLHFLVWGLLHGIYLLVDSLTGQRIRSRIFTFWLVGVAWIFFRAESLEGAFRYIRQLATAGLRPERLRQAAESLQLNGTEIGIVVIGIFIVWLADRLCDREKMDIPILIQQKTNGKRYLVFYLLLTAIFIFGIYGSGYHTEQFIYMRF